MHISAAVRLARDDISSPYPRDVLTEPLGYGGACRNATRFKQLPSPTSNISLIPLAAAVFAGQASVVSPNRLARRLLT